MGKKLAIKGHPTRGKEVIELLEMMGGHATIIKKISNETDKAFFISDIENCFYRKSIRFISDSSKEIEEFNVFTLEEFLEKYPFKVGDKVVDCYGDSLTIKSMGWSEDCESMVYDFKDSVIVLAAEDLLKYNAEFLVNKEKGEEADKMLDGFILDHLHRNHLKNVLSELYEHIKMTPKEDLEREFEEIESEGWAHVGPTVEEFMDFCDKVNKKPKYPTTFEECAEIMHVGLWNTLWGEDATEYEKQTEDLINAFIRLKVCRDAYWKIAGEEMGLNGPWEPTYGCGEWGYWIGYSINVNKIYLQDSRILVNHTLVFPTEEMRDAFYENFKDLIEQCKELL